MKPRDDDDAGPDAYSWPRMDPLKYCVSGGSTEGLE